MEVLGHDLQALFTCGYEREGVKTESGKSKVRGMEKLTRCEGVGMAVDVKCSKKIKNTAERVVDGE